MSKKKAMFFKGASGGGSDADADAFITAASITDSTIQDAITALVLGLKDETRAGGETWSKYHAIYPFASDTGTSTQKALQHRWNLKNPLDTDAAFRLTYSGTITHSDNGVQGDGSTGYISTNLIPATVLALSDFAIEIYSKTDVAEESTDIGFVKSENGARLDISIRDSSNLFRAYSYWVSAGYAEFTVSDSLGLFTNSRSSATSNKIFKDGGFLIESDGNPIEARLEFLTSPLNLMALNTSGSFSRYSSRQYAFLGISSSLTDLQVSENHTVIEAYQTALNRAV